MPPAKQPSTPVLRQKSISSFFSSSPAASSQQAKRQQSSITSFFQQQQQKQSSTEKQEVLELDGIEEGDLLMEEDEMLAPAKSTVGRRVLIEDDEESPVPSSDPIVPTSSPSKRPKKAIIMSGSRTPLARSIIPTSQRASSEDLEEDKTGRYDWLMHVKDANGNKPDSPDYDPRTLYIPPAAWNKFTPFEKQFWEIKSKLMDTVVFFKKGKFYELYEGDADVGARMFDLKMTDRVNMRMVGVPEATFDWWAGKFVAAGYRIARVDQTETSISKGMKDRQSTAKADKIIKRELSSILTAGTLVDPAMLTSDLATFCMAIQAEHLGSLGVAFVDASTASFSLTCLADDPSLTKLTTLLMQVRPKEIIVPKGRTSKEVLKLLQDLLPSSTVIQTLPLKEFWDARRTADELDRSGFAWPDALRSATPAVLSAFGGLYWYLRELKLDQCLLGNCPEFQEYNPLAQRERLHLDGQTLANLEVLVNSEGQTKGSLFGLMDHCLTPFGRRLLRIWIGHPLQDAARINQRLDSVDYLLLDGHLKKSLEESLKGMPDLERLISRIHSGSAKVKDFLLVLDTLQRISGLLHGLDLDPEDGKGAYLRCLVASAGDFEAPLDYFMKAFDHGLARKEGNVIPAKGVDAAYDSASEELNQVQQELADYLRDQEKALKCCGLKYRDLGKELYQLEVPSTVEVSNEYTLMSKTKTVNRFWTKTIKDLVRRFQEAEVLRAEALQSIYISILRQFSAHAQTWRQVVNTLAELDCLLSLARCSAALAEPKCRPTFVSEGESRVSFAELRHPCIPAERVASFIPNDICLGPDASRMLVLTGPNMGGKSTLLRQTCLATIMAQVGCYVPAAQCTLTPVDRIFTRLGANDNILAGQSTFMVELSETSRILNEATDRSLVILDELGRGTSTFDGLAIAQAVLFYLVERVRCLGLFATHYRQLAVDIQQEPRVLCAYMACDADNQQKRITFLYKLTPGISPKSYGMNVAALAGIPHGIIDEAELVAQQFETCLSISELSHQNATLKAIDLFKLLLAA